MRYHRASLLTYLLQGLRVVIIVVACLAVLVPLAYLLINSLKLPREFLTVPPTILPSEVTFEHYQQAFGNPKTLRFFLNSLIVSSVTTVVTIAFGTLAAYGLARMGLSARWLGVVVFTFLFIRFYPS